MNIKLFLLVKIFRTIFSILFFVIINILLLLSISLISDILRYKTPHDQKKKKNFLILILYFLIFFLIIYIFFYCEKKN
jgi:hypothetical protein